MSKVFRRRGSWWIDFRDHFGKRHRHRVSTEKALAVEALKRVEGDRARGEWGLAVGDSKISFSDFVKNVWWLRIRIKESTKIRWTSILKVHLLPRFGAMRLSAIDRGRVEHYLADRSAESAANGTLHKEYGLLIHILNCATRWPDNPDNKEHFFLRVNPLAGGETLLDPEDNSRTRTLSDGEIGALLSACAESSSPWLKPFVLFSLNVGTRRGETLALTRGSVDLEARTARLTETKNGKPRTAMLNDTAAAVLRALPCPLLGSERYFQCDGNHLVFAFRKAAQRAGIEDLRIHDLRHHFASAQLARGTNLLVIQKLLGHSRVAQTERYAHAANEALHLAVNAVEIGAPAPAELPEARAAKEVGYDDGQI
jgi:integrase